MEDQGDRRGGRFAMGIAAFEPALGAVENDFDHDDCLGLQKQTGWARRCGVRLTGSVPRSISRWNERADTPSRDLVSAGERWSGRGGEQVFDGQICRKR